MTRRMDPILVADEIDFCPFFLKYWYFKNGIILNTNVEVLTSWQGLWAQFAPSGSPWFAPWSTIITKKKGEGGFQGGAHWAPTYGDWYCTTYHDFMLEIRSQIPILPRMSSPHARFKPNLKFVCPFLRSKFNNGKAVNSYQWKLFKPLQLSFDVVSRQRVPLHHRVVAVPLPFVK